MHPESPRRQGLPGHPPRHARPAGDHGELGVDVLPDPRPARPGAGPRLPGRAVHDRLGRHPAASPPGRSAGSRASARRHAIVLGALYGVAQILQTAGPRAHRRPASRASSPGCTSWPRPCSPRCCCAPGSAALTWVAVLLAVAGLGVLTLGDVCAGLGLGYGEALTLVSALIYALHIVGLGAWSNARDALGHVDRPVHRDRRDLHGRRGAGRDRAPADRPPTGSRSSTWRCSPGPPRCSARPGHRPTCRRPARRSS